MANKLIDTLTMPDGVSYDIEAKYFGGLESTDFAKASDLNNKANNYYCDDTLQAVSDIKVGDVVKSILMRSSITYMPTGESDTVLVFDDSGYLRLDHVGPGEYELVYVASDSRTAVLGGNYQYQDPDTGDWTYRWVTNYAEEPFELPYGPQSIYNINPTYSMGLPTIIQFYNTLVNLKIDPEYNYNAIQSLSENKADNYKIGSSDFNKGSLLQVGIDASGKTLVFNPELTQGDFEVGDMIVFSSGAKINVCDVWCPSPEFVSAAGERFYIWEYDSNMGNGELLMSTYVLPDNIGTIQSIYSAMNVDTAVRFAEAISVDPEYNYNEIQNLKTEIENLEAGSSSPTQAGNGIYYGTCYTAYNNATKTVNVDSSFELKAGATVAVKFSYYNSASSPTLNVNNTGAKSIYAYGTTTTNLNSSTKGWANNSIVIFVYDGLAWIRTYWTDTDTNTTYTNASLGQGYGTCTDAASTTAKTVSLSSYYLTTGGIVAVNFSNTVPANATLNINNRGAKNIYHKGSPIASGIIKAGDTATFIYNGTYYHLLTVDRDEVGTGSAVEEPSITAGVNDLVNINPGDTAGVGCTLYFPITSFGNFYGSNSRVLYETLAEFSDGTIIYGKSNEGWALYIYYNGKEEKLWSSGDWMDAGKAASTAASSKYVLPEGTIVTLNKAKALSVNKEYFKLSNVLPGPARTTKENYGAIAALSAKIDAMSAAKPSGNIYPNFSSENRPENAISGKVITWSGEMPYPADFDQRFIYPDYLDTTQSPTNQVDIKIKPEIWMRTVKLGTGGYAYVFIELNYDNYNLAIKTVGVYTSTKAPSYHENPVSAIAAYGYASYDIKKRDDNVTILYDADNPNIRGSFYFPIGSYVLNKNADGYHPWLLAFSDNYIDGSNGALKTIGLAATGSYTTLNSNWVTSNYTLTLNKTKVELFSKYFKTVDTVVDTDTSAVVSTASVLSTRCPVKFTSGDSAGISETTWRHLPALTIDVTKERLVGLSIMNNSGVPTMFTLEELLALGVAVELGNLGMTNTSILPMQYGIANGGTLLCASLANINKATYPEAVYNMSFRVAFGGYATEYTAAYVVETFGADANNNPKYSY